MRITPRIPCQLPAQRVNEPFKGTMTSQSPKPDSKLSSDEHKKLDRSFIKGVAWTGASKWSIQIFTWVMTLVIARILTPSDYGLVAMASVFYGAFDLIAEFGIGSSIVMLSGLSKEQVAQINALSIMLGFTGTLISCAVAVPLGWFFEAPDLPGVVAVMGLGFFINSLRTVPNALLQKEHRFKVISLIGAIRGVVQSSAVVLFAWLGFRYWSLVFGILISYTLGATLTLAVRRHGLALPRFTSLNHVAKFSGQVLVSNLAWYAYANADFTIAGRVLGQVALGSYNLAWTLAYTPLEKVTTLIGSVTPAFFAAVKEDPTALRRYLLRPIEAIALILFPTMMGMSLVARDAILTLLGDKWEASIPVLQLLALYASVRSITPLFPQVLIALRDTRFVMWNELVSLIVLPSAFFFGSQWGINGIAAAWVIAYPVNAVPLYWRVHQKIGLSHAEFFRTLSPAITGSALMSLAVIAVKCVLDGQLEGPVSWLVAQAGPWESTFLLKVAPMVKWALDGHFGTGVRLAVQVICGAVAYVLALWFFHRERLLALRHGLASMRK